MSESIELRLSNFVNGEFHPTNNYIDSYCPSTGKVYAKIPDSDETDVDKAVCAAQNAFDNWSKTPVDTRSRIMLAIADLIDKNHEFLAQAESKDQGKPIWLTRKVDIPRASYNFRFFASGIKHKVNEANYMSHMNALSYTHRTAVGVAGLITPWNLPLYLLTFKIAPALASGCCVVCKPSEMTSVTAWHLCKLLNEAGLPHGVVNMIFGTGPKAGTAIVVHPQIRALSFTGSTRVGAFIQERSAPMCKKLSLELGGKNPALIFNDVDLKKCVETTIRSSFMNQGEICLCSSRIFVQRGIYQQFLDEFVKSARALTVGPSSRDDCFMGALVSKEHLNKVKGCVENAKEEGGKILSGDDVDGPLDLPDENKEGYFMRPTIIVGLTDDATCMQDEIFGPVTCISPFDTEEEVIKRANGVQYGLSATVWTKDSARVHRVAQQLEAGIIWCNCWMVRDLNLPFGGVKMSGIGREGLKDSLNFYTDVKTICINQD